MSLALVAAVAGCERSAAPSFKAIDITGAEYAQGFDLPDADGQRRTLADFKGKVTLVFFGYTQCPDVCPTTLLEIAEVQKALGADGARVQGVFVTVDPERDTPEVLKAYVDNFGAGFVALRGSMEETQAVAKAFKVYYAKVPGQAAGQLHHGPHGRHLCLRRPGQGAPVHALRQGAEALKHDLQIAAGPAAAKG